jgi:N-acetyl-anhydromuramyl-L-alanine amidase AmpD
MTITFLASPYFTAGRQGAKIDSIVVHWMDGTLATTDAEFAGGSRRVSAHYGIEGAVVHQYVHDADTAWHAGDWVENTRSIGIEHSAQPGRDATPATIATSVALMATLCRQYGIDPSRIFPHSKFYATQCPGTLPIGGMVAAVRAQLAKPAPAPVVTGKPAYPGYVTSISSHGAYVTRMIQNRLKTLNYPIVVDGDFGPETRKWVALFQSRHALAADGVVGKLTWAALFA